MAASITQCVRVKLFFDDSSLEPSWFNVSVKKCKTVSDVEHRIISKFELGCDGVKLILSDCRLPPWESAGILRENDCLHVRGDQLTQETLQQTCDKKKKSKKKKSRTTSDREETDIDFTPTEISETEKNSVVNKTSDVLDDLKSIRPSHEHQERHASLGTEDLEVDLSVGESTQLTPVVNNHDGGSEKRKRKRKRKNKKQANAHVEESMTKGYSYTGPEVFRPVDRIASSLSYQRSQGNKHITFSDEELPKESHSLNGSASQTMAYSEQNDISFCQTVMEDKSPEKTNLLSAQNGSAVGDPSVQESVLSSGVTVYTRQKRKRSSYPSSIKESHLNDRATNKSIILRNNESQANEDEPDAKRAVPDKIATGTDYSQFPDLDGPPRIGDKIAYKIIELSSNFCPEVSEYKEASVVSYNPISTVLELQLLTPTSTNLCVSRVQMSLDGEDQTDDNQVTVEWGSLLEPKLLS